MIFYFSGTGNSLWVAKKLAELQDERILSIAELMKEKRESFSFTLKQDEMLGFVFPIYAWAPPKIVLEFIKKFVITNSNEYYTFAVCTCGDHAGQAMSVLSSDLQKQKIKLNSGFSVFMPNNYIVDYDLDSKELENKKLEQAKQRVDDISNLLSKKTEDIFDCYGGSFPWFRTQIINPYFNKFCLGTKKFHAKNNCISCGLCERICPTKNIQLKNDSPTWGKECTKCMACIHRCPVQAIQYGDKTEKRGRYFNPNI
jgi:NAD-dependent dihydropyrimidine dehydrogenase PreA subunit